MIIRKRAGSVNRIRYFTRNLPSSVLPVVPGHQVVGRVVQIGPGVDKLKMGDRVGVGWIYDSCGQCTCCIEGG
ncbi:MAG: alcohol dehydrogenase catalytic domain-containing protein [Deltaproteobacteria bacterium]|nr:alcohol dehydrogenase catalytic domain-containing protein [Deltaproteobacteria bacterium]